MFIVNKIIHFIFLILTLFFAQFLLFWYLSVVNTDNFEKYFIPLKYADISSRFEQMNDKKIIFADYIVTPFGLKVSEIVRVRTFEEGFKLLASDQYDAYLGKKEKIEKGITTLGIGVQEYRMTGLNVYKKDFVFLVKNDKDIIISNRNIHPIADYLFWLRKVFTGNFGKTYNEIYEIKSEISSKLPFSIALIFMTVISIALLSLIFSYLLAGNISGWIKNILGNILEITSSIPEFLICFGLLYLMVYRVSHVFSGYDTFFITHFSLSLSYIVKLSFFLFLPVLALSFSNGNISVLTKYLEERIINISKQGNIIFFKANGMRKFYLNYVFIFKELLPTVLTYIGMKIPLIVGSSVIIEKVFDLPGIGNMAFKYFIKKDVGVILMVFMIVYAMTILIDSIVKSFNTKLIPLYKKQNI